MSQHSTFQETKEQIEQKMLLKLISKLEDEPLVSQRHLATELGVALGLLNTYLKRCITKGWIRAGQVPAKRLAYYLTPEGFKEKGRMVKDYIASSLSFFRDARSQCEMAFLECRQKGWTRIVLVGSGDLFEIARLVAQSIHLQIELLDTTKTFQMIDNVIFVCDLQSNYLMSPCDAVLITDIQQPQETYDNLKKLIPEERILTLGLLHISRQSFTRHFEKELHKEKNLDDEIEFVGGIV